MRTRKAAARDVKRGRRGLPDPDRPSGRPRFPFLLSRFPSPLLALAALALTAGGGCGDDPFPGEEGMVLRIASTENVKGFDTTQAGDVYSHRAISLVSEGLLQYAYLERPYRVEPCLAEALPEVSEDGRTYTFRLRRGVEFHDDVCFDPGRRTPATREVTAEDFVYSFKRVADRKNTSTGWWLIDGRIEGLNEFADRSGGAAPTDYGENVPGLQAPGRHVFVVRLTGPFPQFLYVLTMSYFFAVAREAVAFYGEEILNHPVGTGPFYLKEWVRNHRLVFERNPRFAEGARAAAGGGRDDPRRQYPLAGAPGDAEKGLLEDAGRTLPFCDRVEMFEIIEDQPLWLNFMKGRLDVSAIPKDNFSSAVNLRTQDLLPAMRSRGIALWTEPSLDITYTAFNMEDPVVGDTGAPEPRARNRALRRAMSLAFDAESQIRILRNGRGIAAQGPIPPGLEGFDPEFRNPWRDPDLARALETARRLMEEAGVPGGRGLPPLVVESVASTTGRQYDEFFVNCMKPLGVRIEVTPNTWPAFEEKVKQKKAQVFSMAWLGDYPDAENFLQLFYGRNVSPGSNGANYVDPEFDALFEKARDMLPGPERAALYRQAAEIVVRDCPWIFEVHRLDFALQHGWLRNYRPHDIGAGMEKYHRVDVEERRRTVGEWSRVRALPLVFLVVAACVPAALIAWRVFVAPRRSARPVSRAR